MTTLTEETPQISASLIALANQSAENLCRQLLAFQQAIMTREENKGVPTLQELTMQGRIINYLDKLRRFNGRRGVAKKDNTPLPQPVKTGKEPENKTAAASAMPVVVEKAKVPPPVSFEEFEQYKNIIGNNRFSHILDRLDLGSRTVNLRCFEYNLFQYMLPVEERRFIDNEVTFRVTIDHTEMQDKIRQHLDQLQNNAA